MTLRESIRAGMRQAIFDLLLDPTAYLEQWDDAPTGKTWHGTHVKRECRRQYKAFEAWMEATE